MRIWVSYTCGTLLGLSTAASIPAAELPVPCIAGTCGPVTWVSSGVATLSQSANTMTIQQQTEAATFNWQSFNIGPDGKVQFVQPSADSLALNRIFQADPAKIFGSLTANGRIYLLNRNGIIFGANAQVDARGVMATTLDMTPEALQLGLARASSLAVPALQPYKDANGQELPSGAVQVQAGASITANQGQVLLFAPEVSNQGSISTPDGQTILAAGKRIFLVASSDDSVRGLLVEVGDGGEVTNGGADPKTPSSALVGKISAARGNVTLAGLTVNQNGSVSATTSIRANGSVRLLARDTQATTLVQPNLLEATRGGQLTLGAHSTTTIGLDTDGTKTVDVNVQPKSMVEMSGRTIDLLEQASVIAPSGTVSLTALTDPNTDLTTLSATPDGTRVSLAKNATISVAGASVTLPVERNSVRVELRGSQLADSPVQRDGPLRSEPVYVDIRKTGTRADGTSWIGTPLADVSGDVAGTQRDVSERNLQGGTISMTTQGAILLAQGSNLDISGGLINWQGGVVPTTSVLGTDGKVYDIAAADPNRTYVRTVDTLTVKDTRWGTEKTYMMPGLGTNASYQAGYVEGRSAGSVSLISPRLVFDGNVDGSVTVGPYQRAPVSARNPILTGPAFNELPQAGTLSIGSAGAVSGNATNYLIHSVRFAAGPTLDSLRNEDGTAYDPLVDPLPASVDTTFLRPGLFSDGKIGKLRINANGAIELPAATALDLGPAGELTLRAGRIDLDGSVTAPGGVIDLAVTRTPGFDGATSEARPAIQVGATASLAATGLWSNDFLDARSGTQATSPLIIDGGSIRLAAQDGDIGVARGAVLDVSAGAQQTSAASISGGRGGSISFALSNSTTLGVEPPTVEVDGTLRGFALSRGGSLSMTVPAACITSAAQCDDPTARRFAPDFFTGGGFANFALATNAGDLVVADGTSVLVRQSNWTLGAAAINAASGTPMSAFAQESVLADHVRKGGSLTLSANDTTDPFDGGNLIIGQGASLATDPAGQVTLAATSSVFFDGSIFARGGTVALNLNPNSAAPVQFRPDQGIWVGEHALIDVSGTSLVGPSDTGLLLGSVLGGGSINLNAARGYITTQQGSRLIADGTSAALDIQSASGAYQRQTIGSAGGSINIATTEGLLLNGFLHAAGGTATDSGGTLNVSIDSRRNGDSSLLLPHSQRNIVLSASNAPVLVSPGNAVPDQYNGQAIVPVSLVNAGGFDTLSFTALDTLTPQGVSGPVVQSTGRIVVDAGAALHAGSRIVLDASEIAMRGDGKASFTAPVVQLGSSDTKSQSVLVAQTGPGDLAVNANLIEVVGQATFSGVDKLALSASDELRLRGVLAERGGTDYVAALRTAGDLSVVSPLTYATTLTKGDVMVGGALDFTGGTSATRPILSAGSQLSLTADDILVNSRVAAPGGTLNLTAPSVAIGPTGTLQVALTDTVPFGVLQGGFAWAFPIGNVRTLVFDGTTSQLPAKQVNIDTDSLDLQQGGVIDISGGGDLLAYEWIKGPGGTKDVLSAQVSPGSFAIVPTLGLDYAPYDPLANSGSPLVAGNSIYLSGAPGLPAGTYAMLPARYALLPGAFLVTPAAGNTDLAASASFSIPGGGTLISGYHTVAGTSIRDDRTSGFVVRSGDAIARLATYNTSTADKFFPSLPADQAQRGPRDAGYLGLQVTDSVTLNGHLLASAAQGGQGSLVDISANQLRVVSADTVVISGDGFANLVDSQLNGLQAASLVLGAKRDSTGTILHPVSSVLEVADGASLSGPQIVLAATDSLTIESGATVSASSSTPLLPTKLSLSGSAAVVAVDSRRGLDVTIDSTGAPSPAALSLAAGSTVRSAGTVALAGGDDANLAGTLDIRGGDLQLALNSLELADASLPAASGRLLTSQLLDSGLKTLRIHTPGGLALAGNIDLQLDTLQIEASNITAGSNDTVARLSAGTLSLGGTAAISAGVIAGDASLRLSGNSIKLQDDAVAFSGFSNVLLSSAAPVVIAGTGRLDTAGDFRSDSGIVAGLAGATYGIHALGNASIGVGASASAAAVQTAAGVRLSVSGDSVTLGGGVNLPAGILELTANQDVLLGASALVNLSAPSITMDGTKIAVSGGHFSATSASGNVTIAAGSRIQADGANGGDGGAVSLTAQQGTLALDGTLSGSGGNGGELLVDASSLPAQQVFAAAASGGFNGLLAVHQHGAGDLVVGAGSAINAKQISLVADGGNVGIDGTLNALGAQARVYLAASGLVEVSGAIRANDTSDPQRGGSVFMGAGNGVVLGSGSSIDVSSSDGSQSGLVTLRLPQGVVLGATGHGPAVGSLRVDGAIAGARSVDIEGYKVYDRDFEISDADVLASAANPLFADAKAFMTATSGTAAANTASLGALGIFGSAIAARFVPGIEIQSTGDLALNANWNVAAWRFGGSTPATTGVAPAVTLRAAGDLTFNASLSDGFQNLNPGTQGFVLPTTATDSASYRIVAGADLASASALAVNSNGHGSVILSGGAPTDDGSPPDFVMIRTGTGSIDVASAGDLVLGNAASVIYTAGKRGAGILLPASLANGGLTNLPYPDLGGDIRISAGGNVVGGGSTQLFTDWLWRTGSKVGEPAPKATAWTVAFDHFQQGIGALGGGNVAIRAGGDITDLSASIPSIGRQVGGTTAATSRVQVGSGGSLLVQAGGNVSGGSFYVGRGDGLVSAGNSIDASALNGLAPILAVGDGTLAARGRGDVAIETVVNPTLLNQSVVIGVSRPSYFSTYTDDSAASLFSTGGDVRFSTNTTGAGALGVAFPNAFGSETAAPRIVPPTLSIVSLSGDLLVNGGFTLWPAPRGNLTLLADQNVNFNPASGSSADIILSDVDVQRSLPTITSPTSLDDWSNLLDSVTSGRSDIYAATPVHAATASQAADPDPLRIVAVHGDVDFISDSPSTPASIFSAKKARIVAGRDIISLGLRAQNLSPGDETVIAAGRDIIDPLRRTTNGQIVTTTRDLSVGGPGTVQLIAGRDIDFQTSGGLTTDGGLRNPALGSSGASVALVAGESGGLPDFQSFITKYLAGSDLYATDLIQYVTDVLGTKPDSKAQAVAQFSLFPQDLQRPLLQRVLFAELRAGGRVAANAGPDFGNFTRAYIALTTYYPGSNPDLSKNETSPYVGDIKVYFSRIYTLQGGSIDLLAPGGSVNAGLATPPTSFGLNKSPSELGVVAQSVGNVSSVSYGDFQVNESRVFAADGGNILVWSTEGDIDAGRGAKTAISAPPPVITIDDQGRPSVQFPAAFTGSGIQTIATTAGRKPGDVDLFAPRGVVNAGDAGIVAGNLTIAATAVLGASNITVSGTSVGVPVDTGGLGASLAGASSVASSATNSASMALDSSGKKEDKTPLASSALSWLDVFVVGFGEEACKQDDKACLDRQKSAP